jgi:hypothetical protein
MVAGGAPGVNAKAVHKFPIAAGVGPAKTGSHLAPFILVVRIFPTFKKYLPIAKVIWGFGGLFDATSVPAGLKFDRG